MRNGNGTNVATLSNHVAAQPKQDGPSEALGSAERSEVLEMLFEAIAEPIRWPAVLNSLGALLGIPPPPASASDGDSGNNGRDICRDCSMARKHFLNWATAVSSNNGHRRLRAVRSQMEKAAAICSRMFSLQATNKAVFEALDRFDRGLLFVDSGRKVTFANSRAADILNQHDGLYLRCGRLRASRTDESILLRRLIQKAAMGNGQSQHGETVLRVSRASSHAALSLVITPTVFSGCPDTRPLASIIVSDPQRGLHIDPTSLRGPYGLTKSEAALSTKLLAGKSLATAAAELNISIETARTHLKRIFFKTGTNRQQQLVAMMLNHSL